MKPPSMPKMPKMPKMPGMKPRPLPSMQRAADPMKGVQLPDDLEKSPAVELSAVQQGFRDRAAQEAARFEDATDTGYYSCLVFENRDQLEAFLQGIGMLGQDDLYLDGRVLAKLMGIDLPKGGGRGGSAAKIDPKFAAMVR